VIEEWNPCMSGLTVAVQFDVTLELR
jgi:hypothetical protein